MDISESEDLDDLSIEEFREIFLELVQTIEEKDQDIQSATEIGENLLKENEDLKKEILFYKDDVSFADEDVPMEESNIKKQMNQLELEYLSLKKELSIVKRQKLDGDAECSILISKIDQAEHEKQNFERDLSQCKRKIELLLDGMNDESIDNINEMVDSQRNDIQTLQRDTIEQKDIIIEQEYKLKVLFSKINSDAQSAETNGIDNNTVEDITLKKNELNKLMLKELDEEIEKLNNEMNYNKYEKKLKKFQRELDLTNKSLEIAQNQLEYQRSRMESQDADLPSIGESIMSTSLDVHEQNETNNNTNIQIIQYSYESSESDEELRNQIEHLRNRLSQKISSTVAEIEDRELQASNVNLEGDLFKRGAGLFKIWHPRFYFYQKGMLYHALTREDRYKTRGLIKLKGATCEQSTVDATRFCFLITDENGNETILSAPTAKERNDWIARINLKIQKLDE